MRPQDVTPTAGMVRSISLLTQKVTQFGVPTQHITMDTPRTIKNSNVPDTVHHNLVSENW